MSYFFLLTFYFMTIGERSYSGYVNNCIIVTALTLPSGGEEKQDTHPSDDEQQTNPGSKKKRRNRKKHKKQES